MFVLLRLSLLLPARAVGDLALSFKKAWARTRGNAWRMFWGYVFCILPPMIAAQIILLVIGGFPNPVAIASGTMTWPWVAASVFFMGYYLLILPISIGFLSHTYRWSLSGRPNIYERYS